MMFKTFRETFDFLMDYIQLKKLPQMHILDILVFNQEKSSGKHHIRSKTIKMNQKLDFLRS